MTDRARILDPVCDMVVGVEDAREHGLSLEMPEREYAFCSAGCLAAFAKAPASYRAKVDAWVAADANAPHAGPHHEGEQPVIDAGMREWYKACRCCMHDAHPAIVEQLDAERAAVGQAPSDAGICETAEAAPPGES